MLYVYHVLFRTTGEPNVAMPYEDWVPCGSYSTLQEARCAAFCRMAINVKGGFCPSQVQVRVYANGTMNHAIDHAAGAPEEEAMEFHWRESGRGRYEAAKF